MSTPRFGRAPFAAGLAAAVALSCLSFSASPALANDAPSPISGVGVDSDDAMGVEGNQHGADEADALNVAGESVAVDATDSSDSSAAAVLTGLAVERAQVGLGADGVAEYRFAVSGEPGAELEIGYDFGFDDFRATGATIDAEGRAEIVSTTMRPLADFDIVIRQMVDGVETARVAVAESDFTADLQPLVLESAESRITLTGEVLYQFHLSGGVPGALLEFGFESFATVGLVLGDGTATIVHSLPASAVDGDLKFRQVMHGGVSVETTVAASDVQMVPSLWVTSPASNADLRPGTVTFSGYAQPHATIELVSNITGARLGSGEADAMGAWSVDVNRALGHDAYNFRVVNGDLSANRRFTVTPAEWLQVSSPSAGTSVSPGRVIFTGTAQAGAILELRSNVTNTLLASGTARPDGSWTLVVNRELKADTYDFRVVNGAAQVNRRFVVAASPLTVISPAAGGTVAAGTVTVTGTAAAGADVVIASNITGRTLASGTATADGTYALDIVFPLPRDTYDFRAISGGSVVYFTFATN